MTRIFTSLAISAVLLCCGCLPQSLSPLYTETDFVYAAGIEGNWEPVGGPEDETDLWSFSALNDWQYSIQYSEAKGRMASFVGQLTTIGDQQYMDFCPAQGNDGNSLWSFTHVPVHTFWRVEQSGDVLTYIPIDFEWLDTYLKEHPQELEHRVQGSEGGSMPLITASTTELRAFIERHQSDEGFMEPLELKRRP